MKDESPKSNNQLDLESLAGDQRLKLHKLLYRQECRAWLLAGGLPFLVVLLTESSFLSETQKDILKWFSIFLSVFLAFWVIYPSQKILAQLRVSTTHEEQSKIERRFDNTWQSLWDFGPPLFLPLLLLFGMILFNLWNAI